MDMLLPAFNIYQCRVVPNCFKSHTNTCCPDFFPKKVLPDTRSKTHPVRCIIISTGQSVRCIYIYIYIYTCSDVMETIRCVHIYIYIYIFWPGLHLKNINDLWLFQQNGRFKNIHRMFVESLKRRAAISVWIHLISNEIYL